MKTMFRIFIATLLLNASLHTTSSALQQSPESIASLTKGPSNSSTANHSLNQPAADTNVAVTETDTSYMQINTKLKIAALKLKEKTFGLEEYLKKNGFNTEYCFLVDMSIPSGKNRFFVYNLKKDVVESSCLVSHGKGSYTMGNGNNLTFSNLPNSYATSLGKYKVGGCYNGTYGLSYKLYGLDSTNSKAYERAIVLHSDSKVPQTEIYPSYLYQSAGCPIVSPAMLSQLGKYIKACDKPVLLWIYY